MEFFQSMAGQLNGALFCLIDSALLVLLLVPVLWYVIIRPIASSTIDSSPLVIASSLLKVLAGVFAVQFVVMLVLEGVPFVDSYNTRNFADAVLTAIFSAPMLWWLLFRRMPEDQREVLVEFLLTPTKLLVLLLITVFVAHLLEDALFVFAFPIDRHSHKLFDSMITSLVAAPILWYLVVRPLKRKADAEKIHSDAIRAQVVDAIVTIDGAGTIQSFNPAAETIFGYSSEEIIGQQVTLLFNDGPQSLDELLQKSAHEETGSTFELSGRRRDGIVVIMDISISQVTLEGKQQYVAIMRDVTERKQSEQNMQKSLSLLAATLESTADGIVVVDTARRILTYNRKFLDMYQITEDEIIGDDSRQLLKILSPQLQDPAAYIASTEDLYAHPESVALETLRFKDGRVLERYSQPQLQDGHIVGRVWSLRDITARTEAEAALRESEQRFRQIFEQSEDAIVLFKPGTCSVIDANHVAEQLFGFSKNELRALGVQLFTRADDYDKICSVISTIGAGKRSQMDNLNAVRKDQTATNVSMRGKLMTIQGVGLCYCTFRDITARIRLEEESRNIQAKLIQANKMTSLGLLVSGVAHEINNPNNFIMANSQLLAGIWDDALKILRQYHDENGDFLLGGLPFSEVGEQSPEMFSGIIDGTRRINDIVKNLKGFTRQDRRLTGRPLDLNEVAKSAVSMLYHEIKKHTNSFHLELDPDIPPVNGSGNQLEQVVINLIMNACQALASKDAAVVVTTSYDAADGQVTLAVRDEGAGMSRDTIGRIREPFFTTKLDSGGTGLGLSICQSIVKEHNGLLECDSELAKGTTFMVKLPAVRSEQ